MIAFRYQSFDKRSRWDHGTIVDLSDRIGDGDIRSICENEKPLGHIIEMEKWLTACLSSRTLAQYSTDRYAGRLYFRVRNGTGCDPAALAVIPKHGISVNYLKLSFKLFLVLSNRCRESGYG